MDKLADGIINSVPNLVILLLIVREFLKYMKEERRDRKAQAEEERMARTVQAETCHEVQIQATEAIKENSKVVGANSAMTERVTTILDKIEFRVKNPEPWDGTTERRAGFKQATGGE